MNNQLRTSAIGTLFKLYMRTITHTACTQALVAGSGHMKI